MKWQAAPGTLYGVKEDYQSIQSKLVIIPSTVGAKTPPPVMRVKSVGPDVKGYKEGDIIVFGQGGEIPGGGIFVRVLNVLGRLVPDDAPNSAVADSDGVTTNASAS
jgi:hypothetical protein